MNKESFEEKFKDHLKKEVNPYNKYEELKKIEAYLQKALNDNLKERKNLEKKALENNKKLQELKYFDLKNDVSFGLETKKPEKSVATEKQEQPAVKKPYLGSIIPIQSNVNSRTEKHKPTQLNKQNYNELFKKAAEKGKNRSREEVMNPEEMKYNNIHKPLNKEIANLKVPKVTESWLKKW